MLVPRVCASLCFGCFGCVVFGVGCTPAPVQTFEAFYAATASRDVPAFRALLCPDARASVAVVKDEVLAQSLSTTRVIRRVTVKSEDAERAVVDVEDATGQHEDVPLRKSDGRWCVEMKSETKANASPTKQELPQ